jgi:hypothetical protein
MVFFNSLLWYATQFNRCNCQELQSREMWQCMVLRFRRYLWNDSSYFSEGHGFTSQGTTFMIFPVCCKIQYKVNLSNTTVESPPTFRPLPLCMHSKSLNIQLLSRSVFVSATSRVPVIPQLCHIPSSVAWYILHSFLFLIPYFVPSLSCFILFDFHYCLFQDAFLGNISSLRIIYTHSSSSFLLPDASACFLP